MFLSKIEPSESVLDFVRCSVFVMKLTKKGKACKGVHDILAHKAPSRRHHLGRRPEAGCQAVKGTLLDDQSLLSVSPQGGGHGIAIPAAS